jgi:hypothetical protein
MFLSRLVKIFKGNATALFVPLHVSSRSQNGPFLQAMPYFRAATIQSQTARATNGRSG